MKKVSIIMLVHNAPEYVKLAIDSVVEHTKGVDYELIVVDNRSHFPTRLLLKKMKKEGKIHKLLLSRKNLLFAKGNNAGSLLADEESTHYLLLNSDVEIRSDRWLEYLLELCPEGGISSYGMVDHAPVRADGYAMLLDRALYDTYMLDGNYEWFWSVTKIQAQALCAGKRVVAVREHEDMLHHFGGKSGMVPRNASGMREKEEVIIGWFENHQIEIVERVNTK